MWRQLHARETSTSTPSPRAQFLHPDSWHFSTQPRSKMSEDSASITEDTRPPFRPFTRESMVAIQARISEEFAKKKELEKKRADGEVSWCIKGANLNAAVFIKSVIPTKTFKWMASEQKVSICVQPLHRSSILFLFLPQVWAFTLNLHFKFYCRRIKEIHRSYSRELWSSLHSVIEIEKDVEGENLLRVSCTSTRWGKCGQGLDSG